METMLDLDFMALVITGLGTLFLIGEILVNMRGFFALLGISFMTMYFVVYLQTDALILMITIYLIGLLLILIDGKFLNDGTLGVLGLVSMLTAVALAADSFSVGSYAVVGVLIGGACSFFFPKIIPSRNLWSKLTLKDRLTNDAGYSSMNERYTSLVGKTGITLTDLRPVGTVEIEKQTYSAISNAQWIPQNTNVKVVKVDGTRILVAKFDK